MNYISWSNNVNLVIPEFNMYWLTRYCFAIIFLSVANKFKHNHFDETFSNPHKPTSLIRYTMQMKTYFEIEGTFLNPTKIKHTDFLYRKCHLENTSHAPTTYLHQAYRLIGPISTMITPTTIAPPVCTASGTARRTILTESSSTSTTTSEKVTRLGPV